jgi:hypothetical protein
MEGIEILRVVNIKITNVWGVAFIYGLFNSIVSSSVLYNFTWHKDTSNLKRRVCGGQGSWSVLNNCSERLGQIKRNLSRNLVFGTIFERGSSLMHVRNRTFLIISRGLWKVD